MTQALLRRQRRSRLPLPGYAYGVRARTLWVVATAVLATTAVACDGGNRALGRDVKGTPLLGLLERIPESGRFEVVPGARRPTAAVTPPATGSFWRTGDDAVYTRVEPFDSEVVRREVDGLLDRRRARMATRQPPKDEAQEGKDIDPDYFLMLDDDYYRGDQFQYTLGELVAGTSDVTPPMVTLGVEEGSGCDKALESHRETVRDEVAGLESRFVPSGNGAQVWVVTVETILRLTEESRVHVIAECRDLIDEDARDPRVLERRDWAEPASFHIERTATSVAVHYRGDGVGSILGDHTMVTMRVVGGKAGDRPKNVSPADAFDVVNAFLLKVSQCRALPWEYVDFAAADSYVRPVSERYEGPTPLLGGYACEHEIPESERAGAIETEATLG